MFKIFICYRRDDSGDATTHIYEYFENHFGRDSVFMDVDAIPLGVDFRKHLNDAVAQCNVMLVVIGRDWLERQGLLRKRRLDDARDFVRIEIEVALGRGIPVIPVLVRNASMPGPKDLPPSLQNLAFRQAAPVRAGRDFRSDMKELIRSVTELAGCPESRASEASGQASTPSPEPPAKRGGKQKAPVRIRNSLRNVLVRISEGQLPGKREIGKPVYVSTTCVSNGDYLRYVRAGGTPPTVHELSPDLQTWTDSGCPEWALGHPVVFVKHRDAVQYCEWLTDEERKAGLIGTEYKYALPTIAEWRVLARGVELERSMALERHWVPERRQPTESVSSDRPSPVGCHHVFGNVFEWCADSTVRDIRRNDGRVFPRTRCFAAIGGGWASTREWLTAGVRQKNYGAIWCPGGWAMKDGGFRVWLFPKERSPGTDP